MSLILNTYSFFAITEAPKFIRGATLKNMYLRDLSNNKRPFLHVNFSHNSFSYIDICGVLLIRLL